MEVVIADSFKKSFKKVIWQQTSLYKFFEYFRYDLPNFIRNVYTFRKELHRFFWWDYTGMLLLMRKSLDIMSKNQELYGNEVEVTRLKKVAKMRRASELITNIIEDNFIEQAEKSLNKKVVSSTKIDDDFNFTNIDLPESVELDNNEIFELSNKIGESQKIELFQIFQGQDFEGFKKLVESNPGDEKNWENWFDGSGVSGWWD